MIQLCFITFILEKLYILKQNKIEFTILYKRLLKILFIMSFLKLPIEIFINDILILLSINDLIEFSRISKTTNEYINVYLKCNNCNMKIKKKKDIYEFKECHECKILICKNCQTACNNYEYCDNTYCEYCLITELCNDCEEFLQNSSNDDEDY